jgi:hypothetical protein
MGMRQASHDLHRRMPCHLVKRPMQRRSAAASPSAGGTWRRAAARVGVSACESLTPCRPRHQLQGASDIPGQRADMPEEAGACIIANAICSAWMPWRPAHLGRLLSNSCILA